MLVRRDAPLLSDITEGETHNRLFKVPGEMSLRPEAAAGR